MNAIDNIVETLYAETLEQDNIITREEMYATMEVISQFNILKEQLPPHMISKLLQYDTTKGNLNLLANISAFKKGFLMGIKVGQA